MIRIQNIRALFIKQLRDTFKNPPVLVLFLVYPIIAFVMTQAMKDQTGTSNYFLSIFATMHCVFTPLVATSSFLSEEKEKNTLRVLIMSNVTLREYFISIGGFILIANLLTGSAFLFISENDVAQSLYFLLSIAIGCLISIVFGSCIGLYAKNAAAANGLAVPFGMVFAFLPMLAYFNKGIEGVSKFTFSQQISYTLAGNKVSGFGVAVICINLVLFSVLATVLYKKSLSED